MHDAHDRERFFTASPGCPEYACSGTSRMTGLLWERPGMAVCDHLTESALDANLRPMWSDGTEVDDDGAGMFIRFGMDRAHASAEAGDDIVLGVCLVNSCEERLCACVALRESALTAAPDGERADA